MDIESFRNRSDLSDVNTVRGMKTALKRRGMDPKQLEGLVARLSYPVRFSVDEGILTYLEDGELKTYRTENETEGDSWQDHPATDKQRSLLRKLGMDSQADNSGLTKGQASDAIDGNVKKDEEMVPEKETKENVEEPVDDDPLAMLKKLGTKSENVTASDDDIPNFDYNGSEVDDFIKARIQIENLEVKRLAAEGKLLKEGSSRRNKHLEKTQRYVGSVRLRSKESGKMVMVTSRNSYSDIDIKHKKVLQEQFGEDFVKYFEEIFQISIKPESAKNPEFLKKLMTLFIKAVEEDSDLGFANHFDVKYKIKVKPSYHEAAAVDTKLQSQGDVKDKKVIKPSKLSVKVVK